MNRSPAYKEYANKSRPAINWDTPEDSWVGIWGYDWSDQLASEILKLTNEFEHEVWQPDMRADKIYSHTFKNGLTHRMFPVVEKPNKEFFSPLMVIVLIIFYNGKYLLAESISSCLANDYPSFEVVVIDNGSTDGTKEVKLKQFRPTVSFAIWRGFTSGLIWGFRNKQFSGRHFIKAEK